MTCIEAGEKVEHPSVDLGDRHNVNRFLRHARTCRECRDKYGMEKIATAIHAVVMSLEEA